MTILTSTLLFVLQSGGPIFGEPGGREPDLIGLISKTMPLVGLVLAALIVVSFVNFFRRQSVDSASHRPETAEPSGISAQVATSPSAHSSSCDYCGARLNAGATECPKCGAPS